MKLYQNPMSPPCRRVLATIYHLNSPVELVSVDFQSGQLQSPEYLKMNPNGAVPLLDDNGFYLWESTAIMQYLAEKKGDAVFYPKELQAHADVNRWVSWSALHFGPAAGTFVWENFFKKLMKMGVPDEGALKEAAADFHKYAKVLDQQLAHREFVAGKSLTLADYALASHLMYAEASQIPWNEYSHIKSWYKRIEATDGWKKSNPPQN